MGTVRTNFARNSDLREFIDIHRMRELGPIYPARVSLTSKLIVAAAYRTGRVAAELSRHIFVLGTAEGIAVDFIDCEERLVPFYKRLGYRRTSTVPFNHPELGPRVSMRLFTDREYLAGVRSAFRGLSR